MQPARANLGSAPLDGTDLGGVAAAASDCELCRLCTTRTNVVFGHGNSDARIMFVGEAPGYHDDRSGDVLAGGPGGLYDDLLADVGLTRDDVYTTTVVKCRPPRNRSPFPDEVEQCEGYLFRQVTLVQPDVICALGNVAVRLLTGKAHRLSNVHGQRFEVVVQGKPVTVVPLFHPAAVAHDTALRANLRDDLRAVVRRLTHGGVDAPSDIAASIETAAPKVGAGESTVDAAPASDDAQLSLNIV